MDIIPVIEEEINEDKALIDKLGENKDKPQHHPDERIEETPHRNSED